MADRAAQVDDAVLRGGASQADGTPPYLPFLEAPGSFIRAAREESLSGPVATQAARRRARALAGSAGHR
jgi:hypothetical protein